MSDTVHILIDKAGAVWLDMSSPRVMLTPDQAHAIGKDLQAAAEEAREWERIVAKRAAKEK